MSLEAIINFLERQPQLPRQGDGSFFFSCYLMRDNDAAREQGLEIPRDVLKAIHAQSSMHSARVDNITRTVLALREVDDTVDDSDETTTTDGSSGGICSVLSTLGETAIGGIKSALKGASRVYRVAEILAGAFGPSRTRQKVERCLAEIGCLLIVLSLVFALVAAASGKFKYSIFVSICYAVSLALIFGYGVMMVALANKMATDNTYSDKFGRGAILASLIPIGLFILLVALV